MLSGLWQFLTTRAPLGGGSDVAPCGNDLAADCGSAVRLPPELPDTALHGSMRHTVLHPDQPRADVLWDLISVVTFGDCAAAKTPAEREFRRDVVAPYLAKLERADPLRDRATLAGLIRRAAADLGYLQLPASADDVAALVLQRARHEVVVGRVPYGTNGEPGALMGGSGGDVACGGGCDAAITAAVPENGAPAAMDARGLYVGLRRTGDGPTGGICRCAGCGLAHRVRADLKCPFCGGCALPGRKAPVITTTAVVNGVPRTYQTAVREDYAGRTGSVAA